MKQRVDNPSLYGLPVSNQDGLHPDLEEIVRRHKKKPSRRPIADHTRVAFKKAESFLKQHQGLPLILDSCCGRGDSSFWAADRFAGHIVIGLDKSVARLDRQDKETSNVLLLQADVRDFWRLAVQANWKSVRHHIFYPNPYPKSSQLQKRWHASSAFPALIALGGVLELRTNFDLYAEEWSQSLRFWGHQTHVSRDFAPDQPVSLFEKKYQERGQTLHQVVCDLS